MISNRLLELFSKLYKEEFGIELSEEEKKEQASRLKLLYESVLDNPIEIYKDNNYGRKQ